MIDCISTANDLYFRGYKGTHWDSLQDVKDNYFRIRNRYFFRTVDREGYLLIVGRNSETDKLGVVVFWERRD